MFHTRFKRCILPVLLCVALPLRAAGFVYEADRIVAISDIHGAYGAMVTTLEQAGVIDPDKHWSGGETQLVIVGDILDRGPDSRRAMDLLMRLEKEAGESGGRVHVLIGNHEAMVLTGDLRYVSREEYAAFADEEAAETRDYWFQRYAEKRDREGLAGEELRAKFDTRFPAGYFAYREAFSPDGPYGRWLLSKPIMIVIDDTAFVHGGVSPMIAGTGLAGINELVGRQLAAYAAAVETLTDAEMLLPTDGFLAHSRQADSALATLTAEAPVASAIKTIDDFRDSEALSLEGPLWYRGNVACNAIIEIDRLDAVLDAVGAERVVIGHTPTWGRQVLERFEGRVIEVDTGMLTSYYEGSGHALVIEDGDLSVVGEDGTVAADPEPHPRRVGLRPENLDAGDIERLLRDGDVVADVEDSFGRRILTVSDGEHRVEAEFARRAGRGFYPEVAAYRVDRLLQLDMVPVAVLREFNGDDGVLQFLPPGLTDETRRQETGRGSSAWCPLPLQWDAMLVFDALIYNEGRTGTSIRYMQSNWQLVLAEHAKSFGTSKDRPRHLENVPIEVTPGWRRALEALDDVTLEQQLKDVLSARQIRALAARRDELLALASPAAN